MARMKEQELSLRFPCWVIADERDEVLRRSPSVSVMQTDDKNIVQLFMEQDEAKRFITQANLTGKAPFTIPSIQHLLGLVKHLQKGGVQQVHIFFPAKGGISRADMGVEDFIKGLQDHLQKSQVD